MTNFKLNGKLLKLGSNFMITSMITIGAGQVYTVPVESTSVDFKYVGDTGTTATIVLSGVSFVIYSNSGTSNAELIWDYTGTPHNFGSGLTATYQVTVLGTVFNLTFNRGSLLLNIAKDSTPPFDSNFYALNQTNRTWRGITAAPNGNIYTIVSNGNIYMRTNGTGDFNSLNQTVRNYTNITAAPNGNIYACCGTGDIYMQTNGTGDFNALNQTNRFWYGMAAAPNGNIYACGMDGFICMQTNGVGDFNIVVNNGLEWFHIATAPNGNVYAITIDGNLYLQTNGTGDFNDTGIVLYYSSSIAVNPYNNNIYAVSRYDGIYVQYNSSGNFISLNQSIRYWRGVTIDSSGNAYAVVSGGDIYKQLN